MEVDIHRQIPKLRIRPHNECCVLLKRQRSSVRIAE